MATGSGSHQWRFWSLLLLQLIIFAQFVGLIVREVWLTTPSVVDNVQEVLLPKVDHFNWTTNKLTAPCFYVEDICYTSNRFIYRRRDRNKRQPNWLFFLYDNTTYRFEPWSDDMKTMNCHDSPTTNHIILFSMYNDMLGEFYTRSILFLYRLSLQFERVTQDSQLYIHMFHFYKDLLDSHHLFTSPFRTHPLRSLKNLVEDIPCTCFPRLIFCGYHTRTRNDSVVELHAGGPVEFDNNLGSLIHRDLRNFMRRRMIDENPSVQTDIQLFRQKLLGRRHVSEMRKWKIVGLAQRNVGRRWRHLSNLMREVQERLYEKKILLVEMNLEERTSSPYQQLVRHGALDALIGIHGAQMTEAIWMKPGSWVVELLPYIPQKIQHGRWTRWTGRPTPLGIMWDNTDLNHVGYLLDRESAPYCFNKDVESNLDCWRSERWEKRDFQINASFLEKIVTTFIAEKSPTHGTLLCNDIQDKAGKHFVLYNVNCVDQQTEGVGALTPHHYYK